ncbi:hypothetical protein JHK86_048426 [Glycine max]|nr:hypothetical protein JHK86_048426 [Glycine max]
MMDIWKAIHKTWPREGAQGLTRRTCILGVMIIEEKHVVDVNKILEEKEVDNKWYNLCRLRSNNWYNNPGRPEIPENTREVEFVGKINARISLDGAYHDMDKPSEYSSELRPSSKELCSSSIGMLEVGIIKATTLVPMKNGGARTDAYCVAKYGPKWVQTRTVVNSLSPKWNEQHAWKVYDPFIVITIVVFDNNQLDANSRARGEKDATMGKIRIQLSTLENEKVYALSYPLVGVNPSGVKKMGEIHLAVRRYFKRPRNPCHTDAILCGANVATLKDLQEELDMFPTQLEREPLTWRYDRLRIVTSNAQKLTSDLATLGEKLQALVTWGDQRATTVFLLFCGVGFLVTIIVPARALIFIWITYYLRHPRLWEIEPFVLMNFISRMPSKQAYML